MCICWHISSVVIFHVKIFTHDNGQDLSVFLSDREIFQAKNKKNMGDYGDQSRKYRRCGRHEH